MNPNLLMLIWFERADHRLKRTDLIILEVRQGREDLQARVVLGCQQRWSQLRKKRQFNIHKYIVKFVK